MATRILGGHVVDVLAKEPAGHFHLAVTSPPYWNLRAYGTEPQVWPNPDGTPALGVPCGNAHQWAEHLYQHHQGTQMEQAKYGGVVTGIATAQRKSITHFCQRCGAWRGELGSEPTVELYLAHLVQVFDAVRRVLRDDGTCWVNLGASYLSNPGGQNGGAGNTLTKQGPERISRKVLEANRQAGRQDRTGALRGSQGWLKPLDYVDVPGLFGRAMQAAGWVWRADIALVKRAPLPESVSGWAWTRHRVKVAEGGRGRNSEHRPEVSSGRVAEMPLAQWADCPGCPKCAPNEGLVLRRGNGRPTRSWERLLVFAKKLPAYWDSEAVREPASQPIGVPALTGQVKRTALQDVSRSTLGTNQGAAGRNLRDWQFWPTTGGVGGEAHYAAYPLGIPTLAVKAGTSERVCPACSAPWARIVERNRFDRTTDRLYGGTLGHNPSGTVPGSNTRGMPDPVSTTLGWRPTCAHNRQDWTAARVLDPFIGSGTTAIACERLGRDCTGVDLQPDYTTLALRRVTQDAPLLMWGQVEHVEAGAAGG